MPETCGNCRFFVRSAPLQAHGNCRAKPPTALVVGMRPPQLQGQQPQPVVDSFWPLVLDTLWCGSYRERTAVLERSLPQIDLEKLTPDAIEGSA